MRTKVDASNTGWTESPLGRSLSPATLFFTASTMASVLPPGTRSTLRYTAFSPFTNTVCVGAAPPSSTRATSRMKTGAPPVFLIRASPMRCTFSGTALV